MQTRWSDARARGAASRTAGLPRPSLPRLGVSVVLPRGTGSLAWALACLVLLLAAIVAGTGYAYRPLVDPMQGRVALTPPIGDEEMTAELSQLKREQRVLRAAIARSGPAGPYIVIDQTHNRLYLKRGDELLVDATCSAGSGMLLRERDGQGRTWIFDTPRGRFKVLSKLKNPVWRKPDWAFVEEGKPIPREPSERIEYGALGEYALYFGDGYMIHGTLYERLLGRSVTHGCIRLGRDDLREVFRVARVGTPIYIY